MAFDLTVHKRDPKTGRVVEVRPYRYVVSKEGSYFERDGKRFDGAGNELNVKAPEVKAPEVVVAQKGDKR
jgi:hypothetical protein